MPRTVLVGTGRCAGDLMGFNDLVDQEQVREQGADMDRSVQVIDQLRTDDGLCKHDLDRRE